MALETNPGLYVRSATQFKNEDVSVAVAGTTELADVFVRGAEVLGFYLQNEAGANALDAFQIQFQYVTGGTWVTVASAGADFTTPVHPILGKTDDLTTLADGGVSHCAVDVRGVYAVKILASGGTTVQTVNIEGYLI